MRGRVSEEKGQGKPKGRRKSGGETMALSKPVAIKGNIAHQDVVLS
jgi:hypothetical protein